MRSDQGSHRKGNEGRDEGTFEGGIKGGMLIKDIYDHRGEKLIRTVKAELVCGDYCDSCGDCMYCSFSMECLSSWTGEHIWIEYQKKILPDKATS